MVVLSDEVVGRPVLRPRWWARGLGKAQLSRSSAARLEAPSRADPTAYGRYAARARERPAEGGSRGLFLTEQFILKCDVHYVLGVMCGRRRT